MKKGQIIISAEDLKVTLVETLGSNCKINIDNPDWNWMHKYTTGKTTMIMKKSDLIKCDEDWFRELIKKYHKDNKKFIAEEFRNNFKAY